MEWPLGNSMGMDMISKVSWSRNSSGISTLVSAARSGQMGGKSEVFDFSEFHELSPFFPPLTPVFWSFTSLLCWAGRPTARAYLRSTSSLNCGGHVRAGWPHTSSRPIAATLPLTVYNIRTAKNSTADNIIHWWWWSSERCWCDPILPSVEEGFLRKRGLWKQIWPGSKQRMLPTRLNMGSSSDTLVFPVASLPPPGLFVSSVGALVWPCLSEVFTTFCIL